METIYIKADANVETKNTQVNVGELCSVECANKKLLAQVKSLVVARHLDHQESRKIFSILYIIQLIHQMYPDVDIQNLGSADIILTYESKKKQYPFWKYCKVGLVMLITFFGAAFTIMAFNNDISITKLFSQIYLQVTGQPSNGFTVLEVTYSIGVAVGILVFFNHFGKKRFTVDPTPMEVEMRTYENDIQTTLIEMAGRKGQEVDVDQTTPINHHRS